jgi:hypothetical protein
VKLEIVVVVERLVAYRTPQRGADFVLELEVVATPPRYVESFLTQPALETT